MKSARELLVLVIVGVLLSGLVSAKLWAYEQPVAAFAAAGGVLASAAYVNHGVLGQGIALGRSAATRINLPGYLHAANATLDADGDLYANLFDNCWHIANNGQENFDQDVWGDACDPDDDNDTLADVYELRYQLNPFDAGDANEDSDGDGISNLDEALSGSDPTRIGLLLPEYRLPQFITPLQMPAADGTLDGQRPLPR